MNPNVAVLQAPTVSGVLDLLDPHERRYVLQTTIGRMSKSAAANDAGFKSPPKSKSVLHAISTIQMELARVLCIDLDFIQEGMHEAVNMARVQGEPAVMISGYREMGKLAGLYVEKKEIDVNIRYLTEEQMHELSEADLNLMIEQADSIELRKNERGEFEVPGQIPHE